MNRKRNYVFLDFTLGDTPLGRLVIELFNDIVPKTAENFRALCTGEKGKIGLGMGSKNLCYRNTAVHRIVKGFCVQAGDITKGDGAGGYSIYGDSFNDENFQEKHKCRGVLSMANRGKIWG